jgi:hypothetical protein
VTQPFAKRIVRPEGLEPSTPGLEGQRHEPDSLSGQQVTASPTRFAHATRLNHDSKCQKSISCLLTTVPFESMQTSTVA